jgi:hypothetical protein
MTFLATYIGGWHLFGFPSDVFADGLTHIISEVICGVVVCLLFIAWFIAPKMIFFKGCLTMGDLMKIFYGEYGQMITGVLGLIYNTAAISIQIVFLGHLCELLGIQSDWGLILAALVLTIYTAKGGMKAVVITDILQFVAIIAAVPLLAHLITYQAGGIRVILSSVPLEKLKLFSFGQDKSGGFSASYYALPVLTLWMLFPGFPLSFPFIQRMLMVRQQQQSANIYYISIALLVPFFLLLALIGLASLVVYPQISSKDVVAHIVRNLPVGLKGLVWTALLAVVMSTADSFLHAAGVSLTHDFIKPFLRKQGIATNELKVAHYTTLFIGCLAIVVVLGVRSISKIAMYGMDLTALLFTIPLVAGIMGLKTTSHAFFVASIVTVTVFVLSRFYISHEYTIPVAIAANALSFFGTHYFQHQGFAVVSREENQQTSRVWHPTWQGTSQGVASFFPTLEKLLGYSRNSLEKYGANPTLFALFMSLSYMIPFFMHSYAAPAAYNWLLGLRGIGALLCAGLLLKAYLPKQLLSYFPIYYHFSLLYCLPFTASFIFFLEGSSIECLINITLAILLLITLVDWVTFVLLTLLGAALGMVVYAMLLGRSIVTPDSDTIYTLVYTLTFSTLVALLFARRKEQHFAAKLREIEAQQYAMRHLGDSPHPATERIATLIDRQVQEFLASHNRQPTYNIAAHHEEDTHKAPDFLHYFFPTALEVIKQGTHINKHLREVMAAAYIAPQLALHSLKASMEAILETYTDRYEQEIDVDLSEDYPIYASLSHLEYILVHVLQFFHAHHLEERVRLWISRQEGVHVRLSGQVLSSSLVQELFSLFPFKATTKNMGLAISRLLIEAHGGHLLCKTCSIPGQAHTEFVLMLPPAEIEVQESTEPM